VQADLILAGGRIRTLGQTGLKTHSHMAIAGGKVLACGERDLMGLRGPRTRVINLGGSAVFPGFNDAHAHVVYYGLTRFAADLGGARGIDDILDRLQLHSRTLKPGDWQHGMGYRIDELTERRQPHRATGLLSSTRGVAMPGSRTPLRWPRPTSRGTRRTRREGGSVGTSIARPTACCSRRRCAWSPTWSRRPASSVGSRES
jgi:hypothetical protein